MPIEVELSHRINPRIKASFIAILFVMLVILFILITINIFGMVFRELGYPPEYSIYFLFLSLLGNYVNLPIEKIISRLPSISSKKGDYQKTGFAASYITVERNTSIAVNISGAVIPVLMSIFLFTFVKPIDAMIGVLVMTAIVYKIAKPVKGSGILNLKKIPDLGMKVVSIGGAGTFDAIFLTGVISVLLA